MARAKFTVSSIKYMVNETPLPLAVFTAPLLSTCKHQRVFHVYKTRDTCLHLVNFLVKNHLNRSNYVG